MKRPLFIIAIIVSAIITVPQSTTAQWMQTPVPPIGVSALAVNGGYLFAGTFGIGVYVSTNNGTSWTAVNTGLTNLSVNALLANGGNLFAGTNGGGVFLTTNNGTSWGAVNAGLTGQNITALGAYGRFVFAGTDSGKIFRTANSGASWTHLITFSTSAINAFISNGSRFFTGIYGYGVMVTADSGVNWGPARNGLASNYVFSLAANGNNLFAGMNDRSISLSTDNGTNWTAINNGLTSVFNGYALMASGGIVFAGFAMGGVFVTRNNGTEWIDFNTGLTGLPPVLSLVASGSYIFAGTGGPVFRRLLSDVANLPAAPTLSSPANGATNVAYSPTMVWNSVAVATGYRLQVSTSSSFGSTVVNDSTLTGTSRAIGPLVGATTYYWRVKAKNSYGWGAWSSVWSFMTIYQPPAAPVLSSPADGAAITSSYPVLTWNPSIGAASYTLNVSAVSDFSTTIVNQSGIVSTSQAISGLSYNTTYYWRVNAVNPAGAGSWSATWSFSMSGDTAWKCIAHWSFDSSSGSTYYDVTGNGYDAIATGTGVGVDSGVRGRALSCPDSGYEISVNNSTNNFNLTLFSIECWAYLNVSPSQYPYDAIKLFEYQSLAPTGDTRNGYTLYIEPSGHVAFSMSSNSGGAWEQATSSASIAAQTWYFITAVYDSFCLRIYINGTLNASYAYQGTYVNPAVNARIACQRRTDGSVSRYLNGRIDELKLYNYALPADSIAAHYLTTAITAVQEPAAQAVFLKVKASRSRLVISLPAAMLGKSIDMAVYTASGREVVRKNVAYAAEQLTVQVPDLALGAYILSVKDGFQKQAVRFVVVR
ncbi:MAG: hypothetical protein JXA71_19905 [Chitinispirillaceae bacterium]|nr:hypothetical protein [Chitinispirillaceae bacterium]